MMRRVEIESDIMAIIRREVDQFNQNPSEEDTTARIEEEADRTVADAAVTEHVKIIAPNGNDTSDCQTNLSWFESLKPQYLAAFHEPLTIRYSALKQVMKRLGIKTCQRG